MEEFEIKGTLEGMNSILQQDFDMSQDEARFFVYILICQDKTSNMDKTEVNEWYLNQEENTQAGYLILIILLILPI